VRDATAGWINVDGVAKARTERELVGDGGSGRRADVVVYSALRAISAAVEVKTTDLRAQTRAARAQRQWTPLRGASAKLEAAVDEKYGGRADVLVMDAAGNHTARTARTLALLQAAGADADSPPRAPLVVRLGATCAHVEETSYRTWRDQAERVIVAHRLDGKLRRAEDAAEQSEAHRMLEEREVVLQAEAGWRDPRGARPPPESGGRVAMAWGRGGPEMPYGARGRAVRNNETLVMNSGLRPRSAARWGSTALSSALAAASRRAEGAGGEVASGRRGSWPARATAADR
jgi:hypothetical protein